MSAAAPREQQLAELADLRARIALLERATTTSRPVGQGSRVCFGNDHHTWHGTVERLTVDKQDRPAAWVRVAGHAWLHLEDLTRLRPVCGICSDCLNLNHEPECAR